MGTFLAGKGSAAAPANTGPAAEPFGFLENGVQTACFFRPSQKYFANALMKAAAQNRPYADAVATPSGMKLSAIDDRLALTLVEDWAVRFRRQYGYVGGD